jgi:hypothetical protein
MTANHLVSSLSPRGELREVVSLRADDRDREPEETSTHHEDPRQEKSAARRTGVLRMGRERLENSA